MSLNKLTKSITESSLSRLHGHINHKSCKSWAIITSYRDELGEANIKVFREQFVKDLRAENLGFVLLSGHGQEKSKDGRIESKNELALFIPNISLKQSEELVDRYKQDGFIYSGSEVDNKIVLFFDGKRVKDFIGWHPNKIGEFYSTLRGRPFVFERVGLQNWIAGLSVFGNSK